MSQEIKNKIESLKSELSRHEYLYYVKDAPEISDIEFDAMMKELEKLEAQYPEYKTSDSPTQRVGGIAADSFSEVTHKVPLLSLSNTYNADEIDAFISRIEKTVSNPELCVEFKIDGLSVALTYEKGILTKGVTRGDGVVGEDVTQNVRTIRSIPLKLTEPVDIIVRGEVFMDRAVFSALNEQREQEGCLSNPGEYGTTKRPAAVTVSRTLSLREAFS